MGLLDELREQSEQAKSDEELARERAEKLRSDYDSKVNPKIEQIYRYLKELEEHLNYLKPDIRADYEFPGYGKAIELKQSGYEMEKGRREVLKKVPFYFKCESPEVLKYTIEGTKKLANITQELDKAGITYRSKKIRGSNEDVIGADLEIECAVPVSIVFEGVLETTGINMTISNYQDLYRSTTFLNPDQVDEAFLDELGNYIIRKENNFLRQDLEKDSVEEIQRLVQEERMRRVQELREAEERERLEKEQQSGKSFLGKLKSVKETVKDRLNRE